LAREKEMLGFYISGHPLDKFRDELRYFTTASVADLAQLTDGLEVTLGGIITAVKTMTDKKGNLMAFASLEDFTGGAELIIFSDAFERGKQFVENDRMVLVTGRISTREGEAPKIIINELVPLEKLTERFNCQLVIKIDAECPETVINKALESLEAYRGDIPVLLAAKENGMEIFIRSKKYSINLDFSILNKLKDLLGDSAAYVRPLSLKNSFS
jgi:DNA polymerase-3 subunit alpha